MELKHLQRHIRTLATLPETEAPVVSCYLALDQGRVRNSNAFDGQVRPLQGGLSGTARQDFDHALEPIGKYLARELLREAKGVAVFSRAGNQPFFLPLQFLVPLPNWIAVDRVPNVYHLVELKDTYHRYVIMISTKQSVRILEVNLGAVTEQVWRELPELRKRIGREWTKEHYQNHRRERAGRFTKEKTKILDELMSAGGYTHLVLAGHPTITAQVRDELPKRLLGKLIDIVPASSQAAVSDIVGTTIASFIEYEEKESRAVAAELQRQIHTGGLAVAGTGPSFQAFKQGRADVLVVTRCYSPGRVWACTACDLMDPEGDKPAECPACGSAELQELDIKEELVRMAEQQGCTVEVVNECETLAQLGGVGCLLRYRLPEEYP